MTPKFKRKIREKTGFLCGFCGVRAATSCDHLTADSRGGTNHYDNLIGCCAECQKSKGAKNLEEYRIKTHRILVVNLIRYGFKDIASEVSLDKVKFYFEQRGIEVNPTREPILSVLRNIWKRKIRDTASIVWCKRTWRGFRKRFLQKKLDEVARIPLRSLS